MDSRTRYGFGRRLLLSVALCAAGAGAVMGLSPGGLGDADRVEVTGGASVSVYREVTDAVAGAPSWAGPLLEVATEGTLVALGLLLLWTGWSAFRRGDASGVAGAVFTGIGTVAGYAAGEAVKLVVDEERPCRAVRGVAAVAECPEVGDWSFPSNHATLATGIAVGLTLLRPRLAPVALPLAGAAALLRVAVGVHYPHDVAAGALMGAAVVAATLVVAGPPAVRAVSALLGRPGRKDSGLMGDHGGGRPVLHAQPGQDRAHMGLDRPLDDLQPTGDPAVGQPAAEQGQHLPLPGGQGVDPFPGGGASVGQGPRATGRQMRHDAGRDLR
ncbi:phosphatase PAP2 family protein [Streptomyces sp. 5-10]|nr:phosphatase PAP2 family protein [Streptomyces sp. 5-10]